jgi:hypothetical protein
VKAVQDSFFILIQLFGDFTGRIAKTPQFHPETGGIIGQHFRDSFLESEAFFGFPLAKSDW